MPPCKVGDRIRLIQMGEDPDPIPNGTEGTVLNIAAAIWSDGTTSITVKWDIKRSLSLIWPVDQFEVIT